MADISQIEMGEVMRRYSKEEEASLMKEITENNTMIIKLQKQIMKLQVEEKRRQESREIVRQREKEEEETNKWIEECRKRNEKEREEKEEKKRIDEEWRRIEKMRMKEERKAEKEWR